MCSVLRIGVSVKQQFTEEEIYKDRDSQIAAIEKTFEDAQKPVRVPLFWLCTIYCALFSPNRSYSNPSMSSYTEITQFIVCSFLYDDCNILFIPSVIGQMLDLNCTYIVAGKIILQQHNLDA
jgi:hypothetical protein